MEVVATELALGTRIKRARERMRWTQRELADAVGVDRKTVDNWENNRSQPRSSIGAIEQILGISLGEDDGRFRAVSDELRRQIAEVLRGDVEAQRRVIGLLEGTLRWPEDNGQAQERPERSAR